MYMPQTSYLMQQNMNDQAIGGLAKAAVGVYQRIKRWWKVLVKH